ncbi:MAG: Crp/Fnr family transcriptional regulator [Pseudomonadota bacterium]|uniref:Crp/Fnr family transcriptional regulator n=1 Tax=Roseovarius TaxID=74030 RepID=UPI0022A89A09|nr:Crp/Fnr family transcriptional regulator [Roseovarius sp. EGI FJ00037]MCZ0813927.1 Crp/Fnr family transcriptional regulator [Roseovarius sp. EGI FJ00037]
MNVISIRHSASCHCSECPVLQTGLCSHADAQTRIEISRAARHVRVRRGQSIMIQGDSARDLALVTSGVVKTVHMTESGDTQVLGLQFTGHFLGRVFEPVIRLSYEAATEATLCLLNRHAFEALLSRSPGLEHGYLLATLEQMDSMRAWMCLLRGRMARERVAAYLYLRLDSRNSADAIVTTSGGRSFLELRLGRTDLASLLDMSPETLCRCLHSLADQGAVHVGAPNHIEIRDARRLLTCAGPSLDGVLKAGARAVV